MQWQQDPHQNARDSTVVPHISSYITDPNVASDYHYEVPCLHSVNFACCRHGKQNDQRSSDHSQNTVSLCISFPVMWTVYIAITMNNESTRVEYDSSKQFVSSIQDSLNVATSKHCQLDKPTVPVRQHLAVFVFGISWIMLKCDIFMSKLTSGKLRIAESSTVIVFRKAWFGLFCTLLDKIDWFDCNHRCSSLARSWSKARGEWAVFPRRDMVTNLSCCITISTENQHDSAKKKLAILKLERKQQIHNVKDPLALVSGLLPFLVALECGNTNERKENEASKSPDSVLCWLNP